MLNELKNIIKGEIATDDATLEKYSRDASMFKVCPAAVVFPRDAQDIKSLVKYANQNKDVSLTARAGGSDMTGGPLSESVVLDFTRHINKIKQIENKSATTEPGVYYRDFEKETLRHNLLMPSYPASRELCAIGGMVANNSGGEKTLAYGKVEDYVQELRVVLADGNEYIFHALGEQDLKEKLEQQNFEGEIYRKIHELLEKNYQTIKAARPNVSKNSAGYYLWNIWDKDRGLFDLTKLFVGSQGTLGIITEVTFKLIKPKPHSRLLVAFLRETSQTAGIIKEVLKYKPESFESYDDKTLKLVFSYFGDFVKSLGVGNIFSLAFKFLPEARMVLSGGFPKLVLLAEFTGENEQDIEDNINGAREAVAAYGVKTHIVSGELEAKKYWTIRREAFNLLRSHTSKGSSVPFIDDLIVRPEKLSEFLSSLYKVLESYKDKMTYAVGGHSGDGNMHIYSIIDLKDEEVRDIIPEVMKKVYSLVVDFNGSITAEHNDGIIRTPFLEKMYGPKITELFKQTKQIFDPKNIFNPGKKVGGSLKYALRHIRKE